MVVQINDNELIPTRTVTCWRVCIDYRKVNKATRKDHQLAGHPFYYFLDSYSGYNLIPIAPEDQEKTTFTSPYGTFAFRWMPFGLSNSSTTFQRCMMAIFFDMVECFAELFVDNFSIFGSFFDSCLENLALVLHLCEEINLILNWEKCHLWYKRALFLGIRFLKKLLRWIMLRSRLLRSCRPQHHWRVFRVFEATPDFTGTLLRISQRSQSPFVIFWQRMCHSILMTNALMYLRFWRQL